MQKDNIMGSQFSRIGRHLLQDGDRGTKWRMVIASLTNVREAVSVLALLQRLEDGVQQTAEQFDRQESGTTHDQGGFW